MATQVLQERFHAVNWSGRWARDTLIFFGGVEALHTVSHVWWAFSGMLPIEVPVLPSVEVTMTPGLNLFAIVINGLITAGLLYGAHYLKMLRPHML
jgi:hypothetical protein